MNPTPTEWTWDQVDNLYRKDGIMGIVAAHNAAVTAERNNFALLKDEYEGVLKDIAKMEKQLAAAVEAINEHNEHAEGCHIALANRKCA